MKLPLLLSRRGLLAPYMGLAPLGVFALGTARESLRGIDWVISALLSREVPFGIGDAPLAACCSADVKLDVLL